MSGRSVYLAVLGRTLNRLTLLLAARGVGPFWIIRHTGRRSGRAFATPIIVAETSDAFVIELTYGPRVDWHRNLVAAGSAVLERGGRRIEVGAPERISTVEGIAAFSPGQRRVLRVLGRSEFERLRPTGRSWSAHPIR